MLKFFRQVKGSIYNQQYYQGLPALPFSRSLGYFALLTALLALLYTVFVLVQLFPSLHYGLNVMQSGLLQYYPSELEISIRNGIATSNVQEPYFVPLPADSRFDWSQDAKPLDIQNVLVVDTRKDFSFSEFESYQTFCLLNQKTIACYRDSNQTQLFSLSEFPDATLNKAAVTGLLEKVAPWLKFIYPVSALMFFAGIFVAFFLGNLLYLFFGALVVLLAAHVRKVRIGYGKAYQLGLHLLTLPLLLRAMLDLLSATTNISIRFWFLTSILLFVTALLNFKTQVASMALPVEKTTI